MYIRENDVKFRKICGLMIHTMDHRTFFVKEVNLKKNSIKIYYAKLYVKFIDLTPKLDHHKRNSYAS